jgi:hypothetical protein
MRNLCQLFRARLGGTMVHFSIKLPAITGKNFRLEFFG